MCFGLGLVVWFLLREDSARWGRLSGTGRSWVLEEQELGGGRLGCLSERAVGLPKKRVVPFACSALEAWSRAKIDLMCLMLFVKAENLLEIVFVRGRSQEQCCC